MIRQFLRVKQIADQKFQRNEKSGILSNELTAAEKRVELIRDSCNAISKKLSACTAVDCKSNAKKTPEEILAQCMEECGFSLGEDSILGLTLVDFARLQDTLASDLLSLKLQVEENVVTPLQCMLNADMAKIAKSKKQLGKLSSEMDSAKAKYQSACRGSTYSLTSTGLANKTQLLREETEDVSNRVEQCRDSLTTEMFNLISREPELSHMFIKLCHLQLEYHRKAYHLLESVLPELEDQINCCPYQPVFGVPLEEHLQVSGREIAVVVETCVCWLLQVAMKEEGLFRIGGSMVKIKKMKSAFDASLQHLIGDDCDSHNVAGLLKLYLRSLPEPLLTYQLYDRWMAAAMEDDYERKLQSLWSVVHSLPETHFRNLRYLIKFLSKLCQNSEVNKMSSQNVAIVMGPNLIWPHVEECVLGMNVTATNLHSSIVDSLITYCDWFFPEECEFFVSTPTTPRHMEGLPSSIKSFCGSQLSLSARMSNGDSAVDSMSSSPTNSPKSPSPRIPPARSKKKAAPRAPPDVTSHHQVSRSLSCAGVVQHRSVSGLVQSSRNVAVSASHENLLNGHRGVAKSTANFLPNGSLKSHSKPQSNYPLHPMPENRKKATIRPALPPPDRPDSASTKTSEVLELDEISVSFESSESESYSECRMSFGDDSDSDLSRRRNNMRKQSSAEDVFCSPSEGLSSCESDSRDTQPREVNAEIDSGCEASQNVSSVDSLKSECVQACTQNLETELIVPLQELNHQGTVHANLNGDFNKTLFEGTEMPEESQKLASDLINSCSELSSLDSLDTQEVEADVCRYVPDACVESDNYYYSQASKETSSYIDASIASKDYLEHYSSQTFLTAKFSSENSLPIFHSSNPEVLSQSSKIPPKHGTLNDNRIPPKTFQVQSSAPVTELKTETDVKSPCHKTKRTVEKPPRKSSLGNRCPPQNNNKSANIERQPHSESNGLDGTPTFFEHYGYGEQLYEEWFTNGKSTSEDTFRTIIEIGNSIESRECTSSVPRVTGTSIKLRINSETQDTRL